MKKTSVFVIFCIILSIILSGCLGSNEPERMVYALGMGLDYQDGKYVTYLQIMNLGELGRTETGSDSAPEQAHADIGRAAGESINDAIFNLYHSTDRRIFWGHLSYVVLTEAAIEANGLKNTIDFLDRYRETRYRVWIYTTREPLSRILKTAPLLNSSVALSKLSDPKPNFRQSSFIQPIDLRRLLIHLDEPGYEAVIPTVTVTDNWETMLEKRETEALEGVTIVSRDKLKGYIHKDHIVGLRWLADKTNRDNITIKKNGKVAASFVLEDIKPKITPVVQRDQTVKFRIDIKLNSRLNIMEQDVKREFIKKALQEKVAAEVKETYVTALEKNADIYRFSEVLYRKDYQTWKRVAKNGRIPLSEDSIAQINVKVKAKDIGKQHLSPTLK